MADIEKNLNNIKNAVYGKDVRESIHDGIDAINKEVENTTGRQVDLENTFDQLVINAGNSNAEIVDARVKSDGTSYSKLGDRLDSVDSQLAQVKKQYIKCSDIGMIANNESEGVNNTNKLLEAIKLNIGIYVDDIYYLSQLDKQIFIDNKFVRLNGITNNAKFIITSIENSDFALFNFSGKNKLLIKDIDFLLDTHANKSVSIISTDKKALFYTINIEQCTFEGDLQLGGFGCEISDTEQEVGIVDFYFIKNKAINLKKSFINLNNSPVKNIVIEGNTINNFCRMFINGTISNNSDFVNYICTKRETMVVKNNIVKCDDNWWDDTNPDYYCFVLWESYGYVRYENNHIEGLKTMTNAYIYDSYLSSDNIEYFNNTWKNNLCFNSDKNIYTSVIIKSKGSSGIGAKRYYTNNKYIIDKNWVEKLGMSLDNAWVGFIDLIQGADYIIKDNHIDVYSIKFSPKTTQSSLCYLNLHFENNIINAEKASEAIFMVRLTDDYDYSNVKHYICNNKLNFKNGNTTLLTYYNTSNSDKSINTLIFSNNEVNGGVEYVFDRLLVDNVEFKNNSFNLNNDATWFYVCYKGKVNNYISNNNIFDCPEGCYFGEPINRGNILITEDNLYKSKIAGGASGSRQGIYLQADNAMDDKIKYFVEYDILHNEGWQKLSFNFTYGYDKSNSKNFIEFTNSKEETVTQYFDAITTTELKCINNADINKSKAYVSKNTLGVVVYVSDTTELKLSHRRKIFNLTLQ